MNSSPSISVVVIAVVATHQVKIMYVSKAKETLIGNSISVVLNKLPFHQLT